MQPQLNSSPSVIPSPVVAPGNPCTPCPASRLGFCRHARKDGDNDAGASVVTSLVSLNASVHTIAAGRTIRHARETSELVPFVCEGWASSSIRLSDGRRQILSFLLSGDLVSASSLVEPMYGRTIEAVTDVTYRLFKRSDLRAMMVKQPALFDRLCRFWVAEGQQYDDVIVDLGLRSARGKLSRLILGLYERLSRRGLVSERTMEFPLRQRHLGEATGLTSVHVCKMLSELQRDNLVRINDRSLTVLDKDALTLAVDD